MQAASTRRSLGWLSVVVCACALGVVACSSAVQGAGCKLDSDCKAGQACRNGTCSDSAGSGDGSSGTSGASTPSAALCDTSRAGWCSCYEGAGARSWWDESKAVSSCPEYSCCYTYSRAADTKGCACTNDYASTICASTAASVNGTQVSSCPGGAPTGTTTSSSGGSSSTSSSTSSGGPTCGEPCPAGCCSLSGRICCKPPFCGGNCVGSPCC